MTVISKTSPCATPIAQIRDSACFTDLIIEDEALRALVLKTDAKGDQLRTFIVALKNLEGCHINESSLFNRALERNILKMASKSLPEANARDILRKIEDACSKHKDLEVLKGEEAVKEFVRELESRKGFLGGIVDIFSKHGSVDFKCNGANKSLVRNKA